MSVAYALHRPTKLPPKTVVEITIEHFHRARFFSIELSGSLSIRVEQVHVPQKSLTRPFRLLQISDAHMDWNTQDWLWNCVPEIHTLVEQYAIESIVFTGDSISHGSDYIAEMEAWFSALPKRHNYAVMGNHDYYEASRGAAVRDALNCAGFEVLDNHSRTIDLGDNSRFILHGLDDFIKGSPYPQNIVTHAEAHPDMNHLLLLHNPAQLLDKHDWYHFDVALAGHTHGGQFLCPEWLAKIVTESPFIKDWYDVDSRDTHSGCQLFVHNATGTASIPAPLKLPGATRNLPISVPRWGMMSELVIHELVPT